MELTAENALSLLEKCLENAPPNRETMLKLSYYLDFAISTESLLLIELVHDRITKYYLENFS